jgi:hypothetical protein
MLLATSCGADTGHNTQRWAGAWDAAWRSRLKDLLELRARHDGLGHLEVIEHPCLEPLAEIDQSPAHDAMNGGYPVALDGCRQRCARVELGIGPGALRWSLPIGRPPIRPPGALNILRLDRNVMDVLSLPPASGRRSCSASSTIRCGYGSISSASTI